MGAVFAAINLSTNRPVALKVLHAEFAAKREFVRRFMREAKAATAIRHPNVIEVFDVVNSDRGEPVMVMELLDGESLDSLLARRGALPLGEVASIMTPVTAAVGVAHALGIIHRDLKPENIFLARGRGGHVVPKVLDFGIAKVLDPNRINELATKSGATRTGSMLGTPHFMSFEQACGEKDIDHRTDVWSIGVILYVMLTGRRPYQGDNYGQILKALMTSTPPDIATLLPGLPNDVASMVSRCMVRARQDRPDDLREVHAVLSQHCRDFVTPAPPSAAISSLHRDEIVSGPTLAAASVCTSQPGFPAAGQRRLGLLVSVGVVFATLGAGLTWAVAFRSDVAQPAAAAESVTLPTNAADFPATERPAVALPQESAAVQDISSTDVPPPHIPSAPPVRHRTTKTSQPTSSKTAPTFRPAPPAPADGANKGGLIEDLPY
ncbi:MAG: serine/threonine protein kinase [Polyangiaceae bacterium]|nr:serine/threonine protein kinase [Polyangiaceae bacterium]